MAHRGTTAGSGSRGAGAGPAFWRVWLPALLLTALAVSVFVLVYGVRYEVNDDAIISNIASGAYGPQRQYLVYVNIFIGCLLKPFYLLLPGLNWFAVLLFLGGVLCYSLLGALLAQRAGLLCGGVLYMVFLLLTGSEFFTRFHYVKYACLFLACGLVLMAMDLGRWSRKTVLGMLLAFAGALLRFDEFVAIGGLAAAVLLWRFFCLAKAEKCRAALSIAVLCGFVFFFWGADALAYEADEGWAFYSRFNRVRTELNDYRLPLAAQRSDLEPLGFSINDFETLETMAYYDRDVFPLERLESAAEALPGNAHPLSALREAAGRGLRMLFITPTGLLFTAMVAAWLLFSKKRSWPAFVGTLALLALEVLYLCWRSYYPYRIEYTLLLAGILFCACCFEQLSWPKLQDVAFASTLLALAAAPWLLAEKQTSEEYFSSHLPRAAEINALAEDKSHLYLLGSILVDAGNGYDVWHARPEGYFSNIVFVGSWLMESPPQNGALAAYGLENPYRDAVGRTDVLLAEYIYRAQKEAYFREHYSLEIQLVLAREQESFNLYRCTFGGPDDENKAPG